MTNVRNDSTTGPARRTITKGAAWAVPVVAVGAAAPMAAASPCVVEITFNVAASCKCPGTPSSYTLSFCATSRCAPAGTVIYITDVLTTTGKSLSLTPTGGDPYPIAVTVNGACSESYTFTGSGNSANYLEVHYEIDGEAAIDDQVPNPPQCTSCP